MRWNIAAGAVVGALVLPWVTVLPAHASEGPAQGSEESAQAPEGPFRFGADNPITGISWQNSVQDVRKGVCGEFRTAGGKAKPVGAVRNETQRSVTIFEQRECVGTAVIVDPGEAWSVRNWTLKKGTSYRFD